MANDLLPENLYNSLAKGNLAPFYLFFGPDEFRRERLLDKIRTEFIPESARDFNLEICYGGEMSPSDIINRAMTMPFMCKNRLILVRRTEEFRADQLNGFLPYLDNPVESTCLIFISSRTDFKLRFFKKFRSAGLSVNFMELRENQVQPWIRRMAKDLGLNLTTQSSLLLQQIVGNRLVDLYSELVKLQLRYGTGDVAEEQVKELAIHSRVYSIFELMNSISEKKRGESLEVLKRFLEEEDKRSAPLQIIGMLNRQLRLLWQTKSIIEAGGKSKDVSSKLGIAPFSAGNFIKQSKNWTEEKLENGIFLLYEADRLMKSGSRPKPVLENLILSICG